MASAFCLLLAVLLPFTSSAAAEPVETDICIYGGTCAGIAAAVQAARMGRSAVILEFGKHLGGVTSGGLGATDIGNKAAIGGISREFYGRVARYYASDAAWKCESRREYFSRHTSGQANASALSAASAYSDPVRGLGLSPSPVEQLAHFFAEEFAGGEEACCQNKHAYDAERASDAGRAGIDAPHQLIDGFGHRKIVFLHGQDQAVADLQHGEGKRENRPGNEVGHDERQGDLAQGAEWGGAQVGRGLFQGDAGLLESGVGRAHDIREPPHAEI